MRLQPQQQVDHLGLHRDVQRRGRLVQDQQIRARRQRPRDHHPLALAARERQWVAARRTRTAAPPDPAAARSRAVRRAAQARDGCAAASASAWPMVRRGLSAAAGFWNTICTRRFWLARSRWREPGGSGSAIEQHRAGGRPVQSNHAAGDGRFTGAGLADHAQDLAPPHGQRDVHPPPASAPGCRATREILAQSRCTSRRGGAAPSSLAGQRSDARSRAWSAQRPSYSQQATRWPAPRLKAGGRCSTADRPWRGGSADGSGSRSAPRCSWAGCRVCPGHRLPGQPRHAFQQRPRCRGGVGRRTAPPWAPPPPPPRHTSPAPDRRSCAPRPCYG